MSRDLGQLLNEVARRWCRTFDARLDQLLERGGCDRSALLALAREVDAVLPDARRLLDAHATHPALVDVREHHRRTVRAATGIDLSVAVANPVRSTA